MSIGNPGKAGLTCWYTMDARAAAYTFDSHQALSLQLIEGAGTIEVMAGKVNNALDLDLANSQYMLAAFSSLDALTPDGRSFTLGLWLRPKSLAATLVIAMIDGMFRLRAASATYYPQFSVYNGTGWSDATLSTAVTNAAWNFIVAWYDAVAHKAYVQLNNGTPAEVSVTYSGGAAAVGYIGCSSTPSNFVDGRPDELFFYKGRALAAVERGWLWNDGNGRTYADLYDGRQSLIRSE